MKNFDTAIIALHKHGWMADEAGEIALEMSALFKSYRTRQNLVSKKVLRDYQRLEERWIKSD